MNTILYIGLGLMLVGFVGFLISASMENYYDKKLKDLNKKYNFEYIKIKPKFKKWLTTSCKMIINKWRGYTSTIKRRTPFYCKIELYNSEDNHFIMVYSANDEGLSAIEINKNIYKSIIENGRKNN